MFVPAATPANIIARLNAELIEILKAPEVQDTLARFGFESAAGSSPAAFASLVKADLEKWAAVVKASGFTAED